MKKPIVGEVSTDKEDVIWTLPNRIHLRKNGIDDEIHFYAMGQYVGRMTKGMAQEVFNVILYPPGSEPSPEVADPTDKYRMKAEKERQYEIPRANLLKNGDWN